MALVRARSKHTGHVAEIGEQTVEMFPEDWETVSDDTPTLVEELRAAELADADGGGFFDPADHSVPDVLAYLEGADDDERTRVLDAERAGKARVGVLGDA